MCPLPPAARRCCAPPPGLRVIGEAEPIADYALVKPLSRFSLKTTIYPNSGHYCVVTLTPLDPLIPQALAVPLAAVRQLP